MNKDMILGIIRHTLTFVGGFFAAKGVVDEATLTTIVGSTVALVGAIWSVVAKTK